jgi:hypothetical protein
MLVAQPERQAQDSKLLLVERRRRLLVRVD